MAKFTTDLVRELECNERSLRLPEDLTELKDWVVAFDLDRTISYGSLIDFEPLAPDAPPNAMRFPKRKLRGGEEMHALLAKLRKYGATLVIATARGPSLTKHQTCVTVLELIDTYKYFKDPTVEAQEIRVDGDSKIFGGDGILVCDYYKPHGIIEYIRKLGKKPKHICFVDDFVVNVCSLTDHFNSVCDDEVFDNLESLHGVWLDPKDLIDQGEMQGSNSENSYHPDYRAYLNLVIGKNMDISKEDKETALCAATRWGDLDAVLDLLEDKEVDVNCVDKYGRTPLAVASKRGFLTIVQSLIQKNADVDKQDQDGNNPIMYAAQKNRLDIAQALVESGANLTLNNKVKRRAHDMAAKMKHQDLADYLYKHGAFADLEDDYDAATWWKKNIVVQDIINVRALMQVVRRLGVTDHRLTGRHWSNCTRLEEMVVELETIADSLTAMVDRAKGGGPLKAPKPENNEPEPTEEELAAAQAAMAEEEEDIVVRPASFFSDN